MTLRNKIGDKSLKASIYLYESLPLIMLGLAIYLIGMGVSHAGVNYLAGLKDDAAATFGAESDLPGYLYGAEGVLALVAYMQTKSPMVFIGLPIVMIFTNFMLTKTFGGTPVPAS